MIGFFFNSSSQQYWKLEDCLFVNFSKMKVLLKVVLFTSTIALCVGVFDRSCSKGCGFQPKDSNVEAILPCGEDGKCACERNRNIADAPTWLMMFANGKCLIGNTGPCGEDDGLEVGCHPGDECIQGICRNPKALGTTGFNQSCQNDVDCKRGLVCKVTGFYFNVIRRCMPPRPEIPKSNGGIN